MIKTKKKKVIGASEATIIYFFEKETQVTILPKVRNYSKIVENFLQGTLIAIDEKKSPSQEGNC